MASLGHLLYVLLPFLCCINTWPPGALGLEDDFGKVTPGDPFVFEGGTLVLLCNITDERVRENSSQLYFDRNTSSDAGRIPSALIEILTTKAIRVQIPRMKVDDEGSYVCKLKMFGRDEPRIIGSQYVTVDRQPKPVENITCIVYNWQRMICTWDLGVEYQHLDHVNVSLVYAEVLSPKSPAAWDQFDCPQLTKTSCTWDESHYSHGHVYKLRVIVEYIFLKERKKKAQTRTERIQTKLLIQPDPVTALKATVLNSTCVDLHWNHSQAQARKDDLFFIGHYKSQWSNEWTKMLTMRGRFQTVVCHLTPFTEYQFEMYVLPPPEHITDDTAQGYSSLPTDVTVKTLEDVPVGKPRMCPGCFYCRDSNCESATIYWGGMQPLNRHGVITKYRFDLRNGSKQLFNKTADGTNLHSTTLDLPAQVPVVEVRVTPGTHVGFGLVSSAILIPTADTRPKPPSTFLVHTDRGDEKTFQLSWEKLHSATEALELREGEKEVRDTVGSKKVSDGQRDRVVEKVTSLFVVWCEGSKILFDCNSDIKWKRLPPDQVTFELHLQNVTVDKDKILIGITKEVTRNGRVYSSGIHWADCVYLQDPDPPGPPEHMRIPEEQSPNQLYVVWDKIHCGTERAYVSGYEVKYCPTVNNTICSEPARTKNVSRIKGEAFLEGLLPHKKYMIQVRAVGYKGSGEYSSPKFMEVIPDDSKQGNNNTSEVIYGAIISVMILIFVILIALCIWKCQRRKTKLHVDEIMPYAQTNNLGCNNKNNPNRRSGSSSEDNGSENSHQPLLTFSNKKNKKMKGKQHLINDTEKKWPRDYDDVISMERAPIPPPSLESLQRLVIARDIPDSKLGDINEEKDSGAAPDVSTGSIRSYVRTQCQLSDHGSSMGSNDGYSKFMPADGSGESPLPQNSDSEHPWGHQEVNAVNQTMPMGQPERTVAVFHTAPRPMLGMSSLERGHSKTNRRGLPISSGALGFPSSVRSGSNTSLRLNNPTGDGYQPNGTSAERADTPVWQLREDIISENGSEVEGQPRQEGSGYSKMSEAPTLERGREGLFNLSPPNQKTPNDSSNDDLEKAKQPSLHSATSPAQVEKLGGYIFPSDIGAFQGLPSNAEGFQEQDDRSSPQKPCEDSHVDTDFWKRLSNDQKIDTDGNIPSVSQNFPNSAGPSHHDGLPNGYVSHEDEPLQLSNGHSSYPMFVHSPSPNGYVSHSSAPDQHLYLTPLESLSNSSSHGTPLSKLLVRRDSAPVPNSQPHSSSPMEANRIWNGRPTSTPLTTYHYPPPQPPLHIDENGIDVPPPYPAPPPPRTPRLNALAAPENINRPLSGVLLDLPLQYYQEPQTEGSTDIQTEL